MMNLRKYSVLLTVLFTVLAACIQTEQVITFEELPASDHKDSYPDTILERDSNLVEYEDTIVSYKEVTPCVDDKIPTFSDNQVQHSRNLDGTINYGIGGDSVYMLDGRSMTSINTVKKREDISVALIGFSPNGEWLAYKTGSYRDDIPQLLHIVPRDDKVGLDNSPINTGFEHDISEYLWGDVLWINDETMLVYKFEPIEDAPGYLYYVKELFDPFTGEWLESSLGELKRRPNDVVSISPDLTRIFYVGEKGDSLAIILADSTKKNELWHSLEGIYGTAFTNSDQAWRGAAAWSPNSEWLAFIGGDGSFKSIAVYLLSRDGEIRLITDFFLRFRQSFQTNERIPLIISGMQWSPDGRFLAIGVSVADPNPESDITYSRLFLYDLKNEKLIDHCWLSNSIANRSATRSLIWSPDSQYIAHATDPQILSDGSQLPASLVIINIYTGEVNQIVEGFVTLGGWSKYSFLNNFSE